MPMYKNDRSPRSSRRAYPEVGNKILFTLLLALCIVTVAVIFLSETLRSVYVSTWMHFLLMCCALSEQSRRWAVAWSGTAGAWTGRWWGNWLSPLFPQDAIVIHEVYEEGAAARDGRLWAGDQILEVNTSRHCMRFIASLWCRFVFSSA